MSENEKDNQPHEVNPPERKNPNERNRQEDPKKVKRETERDQ